MTGPLSILVTAVVLLTMISILVAAHELGHYLFARLFNMGVEEFAIGFGKKPLFTWMKRTYTVPFAPGMVPAQNAENHGEGAASYSSTGSALEGGVQDRHYEIVEAPGGKVLRESTNFTVRPWPLGGFVRIKGMMPEENGGETKIAGGFYSKPPWQRFIVLLAGPAFSVLAGIIILVPLYMTAGIERPVKEPIIGAVAAKGPADLSGIKAGDRIVSIDGKPISTFYQMLAVVRESPEKPLKFIVQRDHSLKNITVIPVRDQVPTPVIDENLNMTPDVRIQCKIMAAWQTKNVQLGVTEALREACIQPVNAVVGLVGMITKPKRAEQQLSGPVTIARSTSNSIQQGYTNVISLAAMLSISVGIMNLLPTPPLDGGQMLIAFVEMLRRGKRLSFSVQNVAALVGAAMVFSLMIGALLLDGKRLIDGPRQEAAYKKMLNEASKRP